jgi:hypothetical protein
MYTTEDVFAVMEYMASKRVANRGARFDPDKFEPATRARYYRGERVIKEAMLKYSTSAAAAKDYRGKASPVVRKMYKGSYSFYWLVAREGHK